MIDGLLCPICKSELIQKGNSLSCEKKHSFDISAEGYVNLAVGRSSSGDSSEMCRARRDFLAAGYYNRFAEEIASVLSEIIPDSPKLICDAGCGEGHYLRILKSKCPNYDYIGFDLAKPSIKFAAKAEKNSSSPISYAVAGIFDLPLPDKSCAVLLSVFAPVPHEEAARVLSDDGIMIVAHPGKKHLSGFKEKLYESPYDNPEKDLSFDGFEHIADNYSKYSVSIERKDTENLLLMTPYYWKTSKSDIERFLSTDGFETELDFIISVFKRKRL